jgi:hypothetical protein
MFRRPALRRALAAIGVAGLLAVSASTALAGGNGATTFTQTMHGVTQSFPVGPLCGSPSGTLTETSNSVFHTTVNTAGDFWLTNTQEAWFTIVPDDPTLPNFAGHYDVWFGVSLNANNAVVHDIFNIRATATDGSGTTITVHLVDHMSISASGQVNIFSSCH